MASSGVLQAVYCVAPVWPEGGAVGSVDVIPRLRHEFTTQPTATDVNSAAFFMDQYVDLCCSFELPVWIASLIHTAKRLRSDPARRRKVYRLLQRKLMFHKVGVKEGTLRQPTYVYPVEVKMLLRSVFPEDICDYPNPCHDHVVYVTAEDLHKIEIN